MRLRDLTIALAITLLTIVGIMTLTQKIQHIERHQREFDQQISTHLTGEDIKPLKQEIQELQERIEYLETRVRLNSENIEKNVISRGGERSQIMRVTAYDLSYESCKKYSDHPEYGETASGYMVQEWHTVAAGPELEFGTRLYIPYFKDKPNKGIFTVEDRGSAIKNGCIDIYMPDHDDCMKFGVRYLEVYVLPEVEK